MIKFRWFCPAIFVYFALMTSPLAVVAQEETPTAEEVAAEIADNASGSAKQVTVAKEVQIDPANSDQEIAERLQEIMDATGWFNAPSVEVDRGVAFLSGEADSLKHQQWAEETAMNTSDVVAVVNRIGVAEKPLWNFAPAIASLKQLGREFTGVLPLIVIATIVGILSYYAAVFSAKATRWLMHSRIDSKLLRQVFGNAIGVLVFIIGMYIALRVSGLTRLAVTLLGGTGLVGLALGFAFRDIAENYLASILISLNHPFRVGDLIEVEGAKGFVRKVTTRGTVLNTLEGNQIQMPNSTVYKGQITNFTATPLSRKDFTIGIGFDDSAPEAQEIIMEVLNGHAAVVADPAPVAIVESLGAATVNLRVLYWLNQDKHSALKVSSSVIRQVKQKLTEAAITMPDEARELVFPQGVPVRMIESQSTAATATNENATSHGHSADGKQSAAADGGTSPDRHQQEARLAERHPPEAETTIGEGDLSSEQDDVMRATANNSTIQDEANLIG